MSENKTLANLMEAFAGEAELIENTWPTLRKRKRRKMNAAKLFRRHQTPRPSRSETF